MYQSFEVPTFEATIFYFDEQYSSDIPARVREVLECNGYFPPTFINVDRLTRGRYIRYKDRMQSYLEDGYTGKDILFLGLTDAEDLKAKEYWQMQWQLTFHKFSDKIPNVVFKPWNVLTFRITYDRLVKPEEYSRFFECFKSCINVLHPFYASMDDTAVSNVMSQVTGMNRVLPTQYGLVKSVHWGNYFGKEYCQLYSVNVNELSALIDCECLDEGVLFTLSDSPMDYASKTCFDLRRKIARKLGIVPPNVQFR